MRAIQAAAPHVQVRPPHDPARSLSRTAEVCTPGQVYIYTGDATPAAELAERAHALFGVPPLRPVACVRLRCRVAVLAKLYPVATLLGQAAGSMLLAVEALLRLTPELFIDTAVRAVMRWLASRRASDFHGVLASQGYAFAYPLAAAFGARVACYTHYPMVSTDMLRAVASRAPSFNNAERVARSPLLSAAKLVYYRALAAAYGAAGRCAQVTMVNSTWTADHIRCAAGRCLRRGTQRRSRARVRARQRALGRGAGAGAPAVRYGGAARAAAVPASDAAAGGLGCPVPAGKGARHAAARMGRYARTMCVVERRRCRHARRCPPGAHRRRAGC